MRNLTTSSWTIRRRFMFISTAFCMFIIFYALYSDLDTKVAEAAVTMSFITIFSIIGAYVFGATWEDVSRMKFDQENTDER